MNLRQRSTELFCGEDNTWACPFKPVTIKGNNRDCKLTGPVALNFRNLALVTGGDNGLRLTRQYLLTAHLSAKMF